jgi:hypothetical protein
MPRRFIIIAGTVLAAVLLAGAAIAGYGLLDRSQAQPLTPSASPSPSPTARVYLALPQHMLGLAQPDPLGEFANQREWDYQIESALLHAFPESPDAVGALYMHIDAARNLTIMQFGIARIPATDPHAAIVKVFDSLANKDFQSVGVKVGSYRQILLPDREGVALCGGADAGGNIDWPICGWSNGEAVSFLLRSDAASQAKYEHEFLTVIDESTRMLG